MAAFDEAALISTDGSGRERLDWAMLRYGPIALFRKPAVLTESVVWLEKHGYTVANANCEACETKEELLWSIGDALDFHRGPFPNLDAFNDDCRNIQVPENSGFAIVLQSFDRVAAKLPEVARGILDIFARTSWDNLLFGRRFLCLVQSNDPWIQFGPVGGHEPCWNSQEWLNADRA